MSCRQASKWEKDTYFPAHIKSRVKFPFRCCSLARSASIFESSPTNFALLNTDFTFPKAPAFLWSPRKFWENFSNSSNVFFVSARTPFTTLTRSSPLRARVDVLSLISAIKRLIDVWCRDFVLKRKKLLRCMAHEADVFVQPFSKLSDCDEFADADAEAHISVGMGMIKKYRYILTARL